MIVAVDSSILIAYLLSSDDQHHAASVLLKKHRPFVHRYALSEAFSTLTGGKLRFRLTAREATDLMRDDIFPNVRITELDDTELLEAMALSQERGVRGGAIYDFLHLNAARKVQAARFYTTDINDFKAIHRPGDPEIFHL
jgi:predicted nucleic acid-binding protein